jgi:hypothetical protein
MFRDDKILEKLRAVFEKLNLSAEHSDVLPFLMHDQRLSDALVVLEANLYGVDRQATRLVVRDAVAFYRTYVFVLMSCRAPSATTIDRLSDLRNRVRSNLHSFKIKLHAVERAHWFRDALADVDHVLMSCMTALYTKYRVKRAVDMFRPSPNDLGSALFNI